MFTMTRDTLETTLSVSANAALTPPESSFELALELNALSPFDAVVLDMSREKLDFRSFPPRVDVRCRARAAK